MIMNSFLNAIKLKMWEKIVLNMQENIFHENFQIFFHLVLFKEAFRRQQILSKGGIVEENSNKVESLTWEVKQKRPNTTRVEIMT